MSGSYSILEAATELGVDVNTIYKILRTKGIRLVGGRVPVSAISSMRTGGPSNGPKRPEDKPNRRHNPSAIHNFIDYEELDAFLQILEESGEDLSGMPRGYMFGGLAMMLRKGVIDRFYSADCSLEEAVKDFYPLTKEGRVIQDNVWLVRGAETYRRWTEKEKESIRQKVRDSDSDLALAYDLKDRDSDITMAAAAFLLGVERRRFIRAHQLERFKWLGNGVLLYNNLSSGLKKKIVGAYRDSHCRTIEFAHWLFTNDIFDEMQQAVSKRVRDDNAYLSTIIFTLHDADAQLPVSLAFQQTLERTYSSLRRMQIFKDKGESFLTALKRLESDIDASRKNGGRKIDIDTFIARTIERGTYTYFYNNYCGRGIQYATFVNYAAAAFLLESEDKPEMRQYGQLLSKAAKERKPEKVDRLKGKGGRTLLVDLCLDSPDPRTMYKELSENWQQYKEQLVEEGCWVSRPRSKPFSLREIQGMYELVRKHPALFDKLAAQRR